MSEPNVTQTFVIVAFRYDQKRSVHYANVEHEKVVGEIVENCLKSYKADVISIRRVYEKCPEPT